MWPASQAARKNAVVRARFARKRHRLQGREDLVRRDRTRLPDGIDLYFDNVGGPTLDAALAHLREGARVVLCGRISQASAAEPYAVRNLIASGVRGRMQGFLVFNYRERYDEARAWLAARLRDGSLRQKLQVLEGLAQTPVDLACCSAARTWESSWSAWRPRSVYELPSDAQPKGNLPFVGRRGPSLSGERRPQGVGDYRRENFGFFLFRRAARPEPFGRRRPKDEEVTEGNLRFLYFRRAARPEPFRRSAAQNAWEVRGNLGFLSVPVGRQAPSLRASAAPKDGEVTGGKRFGFSISSVGGEAHLQAERRPQGWEIKEGNLRFLSFREGGGPELLQASAAP